MVHLASCKIRLIAILVLKQACQSDLAQPLCSDQVLRLVVVQDVVRLLKLIPTSWKYVFVYNQALLMQIYTLAHPHLLFLSRAQPTPSWAIWAAFALLGLNFPESQEVS